MSEGPISVWTDRPVVNVLKDLMISIFSCFVLSRVFLGPLDGRPPELKQTLRGFFANPNCEFYANWVAFHSLASWSKASVSFRCGLGVSLSCLCELHCSFSLIGTLLENKSRFDFYWLSQRASFLQMPSFVICVSFII